MPAPGVAARFLREAHRAAGVRRVVIAWREPPLFVAGGGATWLATHGVKVIALPELAAAAKAVNDHLLHS